MDIISNPIKDIHVRLEKIYERFNNLEWHINKLYEMVNLKDGITACDILCRLKILEEKMDIHATSLNRKWNANSELSQRFIELERCIDFMKENDVNRNTHYLSQFERIDEILNLIKEGNMRDGRKPHKCPVCDGYGKILSLIAQESNKCNACEGKGVIWG